MYYYLTFLCISADFQCTGIIVLSSVATVFCQYFTDKCLFNPFTADPVKALHFFILV